MKDLVDLIEIIAQYEIWQRKLPGRTLGDVSYDNLRIRIDPRSTTREKTDTLIHEALHVYYHEREINKSEGEIRSEATKITRRLYRGRTCHT